MPDAETLYRQGLISDAAMDRLRDTMTHQAEGENPAQPYLDRATQYARTGLGFATGGLQGAGMPMPDWMRSNPLQRVLQNPDNQIAMGAAWSPAELQQLRGLVAAGKSRTEIAAAFPDRQLPGIRSKMSALGLRTTERNEYVAPTALWTDPAKTARIDDLVARGYSQRAIADELGIGKATVDRYLNRTNQTTAAAENPGFWESNSGSVDQLKAWLAQGLSQSAIAQKLGTTPGNVASKLKRLVRDEGELPGYQPRDPYFWESPERQERLKQLVGEGWSLRAMARDEQLGAADAGQVSRWIREMQARHGELQDWVPQGGAGLTAAGKTPTLPKLKSQAGPAPESDPEITKALIQYLRSKGLHAEAAQLSQFG